MLRICRQGKRRVGRGHAASKAPAAPQQRAFASLAALQGPDFGNGAAKSLVTAPDICCGLATGLRALLTSTRPHVLWLGEQSALGSGSWGPCVRSVLETKLWVITLTEMWDLSKGPRSVGSSELLVPRMDGWGNRDAEEGRTLSEATWGPRAGLSRKKGVSSESEGSELRSQL